MTSPLRPMTRFQNNFTEMFLLWPFTKIAKMVLFGRTKWPPELKKKKKGVDCHASINNLLKETSPPKLVNGFLNNYTGMFLEWPSSIEYPQHVFMEKRKKNILELSSQQVHCFEALVRWVDYYIPAQQEKGHYAGPRPASKSAVWLELLLSTYLG